MTTDGERLHAGTLRKVIGWHEAQAAAAASKYHRERKRNGSSTADVEVAVHERAAQAFEMFLALATEADSQPPRLSDWVAACEGTGLGEPEWDEHEAGVAKWHRPERDAIVVCIYWSPSWHAEVSQNEPPAPDVHCSTPAELRACLVRLAGERT